MSGHYIIAAQSLETLAFHWLAAFQAQFNDHLHSIQRLYPFRLLAGLGFLRYAGPEKGNEYPVSCLSNLDTRIFHQS